jgi:hypothetical protein
VISGVPLALTLTMLDEDNACAPLVGAQVDIWHASPAGLYSDESVDGTAGTAYLRGYQVSDASGVVSFTTVYPGWYSGRTVHIHVRVRTFDSPGAVKTDFTSQLFFDDSLTDTVYTKSPYSTRGTRDTRNSADNIYGSDGASLVLTMAADGAGGYRGAFTFGLSAANQSSGSSTTTPSTPDSATGSTPSTPTTTDTSVAASLVAASCTRGAPGARTLHARVKAGESVSLQVRLLRGTKVVAHKKTAVTKGTHTVKVPIARSLAAGRVTLSVTATDARKNTKVLARILQIPQLAA